MKINGFFAWSFLDTFEWTDGYKLRFGMCYVDYTDGLKRYPKYSALWFRKHFHKESFKLHYPRRMSSWIPRILRSYMWSLFFSYFTSFVLFFLGIKSKVLVCRHDVFVHYFVKMQLYSRWILWLEIVCSHIVISNDIAFYKIDKSILMSAEKTLHCEILLSKSLHKIYIFTYCRL